MSGFVKFEPTPTGRTRRPPAILLTADSKFLRLNAAALAMFGSKWVDLAIEMETGRIRLTPGSVDYSFKVNSVGHVSALRFAAHFDLTPGTRWSVEMVDGALVGTPEVTM